MKRVLLALTTFAVIAATGGVVLADIQEPPAADQGPTRKLSRGIANIAYGSSEIPYQMASTNDRLGNAAGFSYGVTRGVGRTLARIGYGVYDVVTFPFPTYKGKYVAPYKLDNRWPSGGMAEFPPELGWESKYRHSSAAPR